MSGQFDIDFFQEHSEKFLEMAFRTDRQEVIQYPDGKGQKTGDCGDTMAFYVMVENDRIARVAYAIQGCIHTNACANAIIELIENKTIDHAWEIGPEDVAQLLKTLPEDHYHCAELAIGALYLALSDLRNKQKAPWKKLYDQS